MHLSEGILPIAINKTTKLIPFISSNLKKYNFKIKWGEQTSTDDSEGKIINNSNKIPNKEEITRIINNFKGYIDQTPPKASAVKVNGKRAYKILREKKNFDLVSKKVFLKSIIYLGSLVCSEEIHPKRQYLRRHLRGLSPYHKFLKIPGI